MPTAVVSDVTFEGTSGLLDSTAGWEQHHTFRKHCCKAGAADIAATAAG